jgi:hypothetical protein
MGSTGFQTFAFIGGTMFIPAGRNYLCLTSTASGLTPNVYQSVALLYDGVLSGATTTGGVLNSTITPPSDAPTDGLMPVIILLP